MENTKIDIYSEIEKAEIITDLNMLGTRSDEVEVRKDGLLIGKIIVKLKSIIREKNLTSLTAPQIGFAVRVGCINFNGDIKTFINPIITNVKGFELSREKCSNIPNKEFIRPRHNDITVTYQTPLGKVESKRFIGLAAKVMQHLVDHLDGLLLSDVGLEIDADFDNATDEEKNEVINMYLDSLDIKRKEIKAEIEEDKELKQLSDSIEFIEAIQSGKVKVEDVPIDVVKEENKNE